MGNGDLMYIFRPNIIFAYMQFLCQLHIGGEVVEFVVVASVGKIVKL